MYRFHRRAGLAAGPQDYNLTATGPANDCSSLKYYNDAYNAFYAVLYSGHTQAQANDVMWKVRCGTLTYDQALAQYGAGTATQKSMEDWQSQNVLNYKPIDYTKTSVAAPPPTGAGSTGGTQAPQYPLEPQYAIDPIAAGTNESWFKQSMFGGFPNWMLLAALGGGLLLFSGGAK